VFWVISVYFGIRNTLPKSGTLLLRHSVYIHGVSRNADIPAEGDFLGLCDENNSYKHVSDFGRLRNCENFLIPEPAFVWTASYQLAGDVLNLVAYRLRCKHYFSHLTRLAILKHSSFLITAFGRHLRNACKVGLVGIRLASVYYMWQLLPRVQKPLSLTLQWPCRHLMCGTVRREFRKGTGGRSDSVELDPYVFSSRCVCYVLDAIYIFSCRVCRYDFCVRFLWR